MSLLSKGWGNVTPNFSGSNFAMRNSISALSSAGTIFDKLSNTLEQQQQNDVNNHINMEKLALAQNADQRAEEEAAYIMLEREETGQALELEHEMMRQSMGANGSVNMQRYAELMSKTRQSVSTAGAEKVLTEMFQSRFKNNDTIADNARADAKLALRRARVGQAGANRARRAADEETTRAALLGGFGINSGTQETGVSSGSQPSTPQASAKSSANAPAPTPVPTQITAQSINELAGNTKGPASVLGNFNLTIPTSVPTAETTPTPSNTSVLDDFSLTPPTIPKTSSLADTPTQTTAPQPKVQSAQEATLQRLGVTAEQLGSMSNKDLAALHKKNNKLVTEANGIITEGTVIAENLPAAQRQAFRNTLKEYIGVGDEAGIARAEAFLKHGINKDKDGNYSFTAFENRRPKGSGRTAGQTYKEGQLSKKEDLTNTDTFNNFMKEFLERYEDSEDDGFWSSISGGLSKAEARRVMNSIKHKVSAKDMWRTFEYVGGEEDLLNKGDFADGFGTDFKEFGKIMTGKAKKPTEPNMVYTAFLLGQREQGIRLDRAQMEYVVKVDPNNFEAPLVEQFRKQLAGPDKEASPYTKTYGKTVTTAPLGRTWLENYNFDE